jgi:hypothetical protein
MKPDTNTNNVTPTWDLKTVLQVQKEFRKNREDYFCWGSETFESLFNTPVWPEVKTAAQVFLDKLGNAQIHLGVSFLFAGYAEFSSRQIRLAFLRHEIKRLKNSKPPHHDLTQR